MATYDQDLWSGKVANAMTEFWSNMHNITRKTIRISTANIGNWCNCFLTKANPTANAFTTLCSLIIHPPSPKTNQTVWLCRTDVQGMSNSVRLVAKLAIQLVRLFCDGQMVIWFHRNSSEFRRMHTELLCEVALWSWIFKESSTNALGPPTWRSHESMGQNAFRSAYHNTRFR